LGLDLNFAIALNSDPPVATALAHLHMRYLGGDAVAAGDKQLGSCAAGKSTHTALCLQ
jgi:hypothetical protein